MKVKAVARSDETSCKRRSFALRPQDDLRLLAGATDCGNYRFGRLLAAISVRDVRGMSWRPAVADA
jgi:hypothetical protein